MACVNLFVPVRSQPQMVTYCQIPLHFLEQYLNLKKCHCDRFTQI